MWGGVCWRGACFYGSYTPNPKGAGPSVPKIFGPPALSRAHAQHEKLQKQILNGDQKIDVTELYQSRQRPLPWPTNADARSVCGSN